MRSVLAGVCMFAVFWCLLVGEVQEIFLAQHFGGVAGTLAGNIQSFTFLSGKRYRVVNNNVQVDFRE